MSPKADDVPMRTTAPLLLAGVVAGSALAVPKRAPAQTNPPVHECDRLAATPYDPDAMATPVTNEELNGAAAVRACREGVREYPDTARFRFQLARALNNSKKHTEAVAEAREAWRLDPSYSPTALLLASLYWSGTGVERSAEDAVRWVRRAAELDHPEAMSALGLAYEGREGGLERSYQEAFVWYRRAAEAGDAQAQRKMGLFYLKGRGVEKDEAAAVRWFRKAADQGDARAQFELGVAYDKGRSVPSDWGEAVKWYRLAADQAHRVAQNNLGHAYEFGKGGVRKDLRKALEWYRKAAEQGFPFAQGNVGRFYDYGRGVKRNVEEAIRWYRKAAEQENAESQLELGLLLLDELKQYDEAYRWIRAAAEAGVPKAQGALGRMYRMGHGVPVDYDEAARWFRMAAGAGVELAQRELNELYDAGSIAEPPPDWLDLGSPSSSSSVPSEDIGEPVLEVHSAEVEPTEVVPGGQLELIVHFKISGLTKGVETPIRIERQIFFEDKPLIPEPLVATGEFGKGSHASTTKIPIRTKAEPGIYKYVVTVEGAGSIETKEALFVVRGEAQ